MDKKKMIVNLQSSLMKLAQAFIEKKGHDHLLVVEKKEFSLYNEQFKALISKIPNDFYFEETDHSFIDEILELTKKIQSKIEDLNCKKNNL